MKNRSKILFIGGDARTFAMADRLRKVYPEAEITMLGAKGSADTASPEEIQSQAKRADILILPLPLTNDGENMTVTANGRIQKIPLYPFLKSLPAGKRIFGGQIPYFYKRLVEECGSTVEDYFDSEVVQLKNAVPTAEGAIGVAVSEMPVTIAGCPIVITGYGRCGNALAVRLRLLGAEVTVAVRRREAQVMAEVDGCHSISIRELQTDPPPCRILFHTVPAPILPVETLRKLPADCILVDLASGGGEELANEAEKAGLRYIRASGLPGKIAPETAGNILAESILECLGEHGGESICPKN